MQCLQHIISRLRGIYFHFAFFRNTHSNTSQKTHTNTTPSIMDLRDSILAQTGVSISFTKQLISAKAQSSNFVFSPLSIHVVLGLIASGSAGPTKDQMLGFLKFKSTEELNSLSSQLVTLLFADGGPIGGPRLSFANGVWVDQSLKLKPRFKEIVEKTYKAASKNVDFMYKHAEVTQEVNTWADKQTNGLIKDVLPPDAVDSMTRLIFANAVYFKGAWKEKFDALKTKAHEFFLLNGTSIQVPFMTSRKKQYLNAFDDFKVLGLPYKQGEDNRKFSMYFFLPDAKDGLPALVEKFGSQPEFIDRHLPYQQVAVGDFRIPKFKINFGFEASEILKGLGVDLPFSDAARLTEMVDPVAIGRNHLYVSSIHHKSFIEVNEEGTEAAAASAAVVSLRGFVMEDRMDFVADHPFLFVIREDMTGVVFFVGQVLNPTVE